MAARGDLERRRARCLELAVQSGGEPADIVNNARAFEAYLVDPSEVRNPEVEELIAAARAQIAGEEGARLRLMAALQQLGEATS